MNRDSIGAASCFGLGACIDNGAGIGSDSCVGVYGCASNRGSIGNGSVRVPSPLCTQLLLCVC